MVNGIVAACDGHGIGCRAGGDAVVERVPVGVGGLEVIVRPRVLCGEAACEEGKQQGHEGRCGGEPSAAFVGGCHNLFHCFVILRV